MTVSNVNNSSNTGYVLGAATLGAGAGVATGYLTKPFLKDGAPTDSFIKKMGENMRAQLSKEDRELSEKVEARFKAYEKILDDSKSVEELKTNHVNFVVKNIEDSSVENFKSVSEKTAELTENLGIKSGREFCNYIEEAESVDELKIKFAECFDKEYAGKSIDEIKQSIKNGLINCYKQISKAVFEEYWDSSKKAFVNCDEGIGKDIKDAARSIQGKYAAIYGAIGAGVLGLGTYLLTNNNKKS